MAKQNWQQDAAKAPQQGNQPNATQPGRQRPMRFMEEDVKTQYAGMCNVGFGAEEVLLLFCNPSVDPGVIKVESKVAMSLKNAKRLAVTLGKLLSQYEAANGLIDISAPRPSEDKSQNEKVFPEIS